ncbi:hypothetical protein [Jannaschia donghaensis]|uniref:Uncharacterized protein n=1 Tax=Jannaschia donghaensis TaxID=420998 RepID=A0A0M6YLC0_9RHOB|nr:hypothetical protein [Jannaschia donghaensis]CTQ51158.1 hypothetical protein JDO7802_03196 [Jannaschia donghaensis]
MTSAPVIHICGWPGSGKRAIARLLRDRIGGRLLDNHLILDPASALFARGTPERATLRDDLRRMLYDAALSLPADVPLILTDALAQTDRHSSLVEPTLRLVRRRRAALMAFVLQIELAENRRRLSDPARHDGYKLTDTATLDDLRTRHALLHLPGARTIDVTTLSAAQAAKRIEGLLHA